MFSLDTIISGGISLQCPENNKLHKAPVVPPVAPPAKGGGSGSGGSGTGGSGAPTGGSDPTAGPSSGTT